MLPKKGGSGTQVPTVFFMYDIDIDISLELGCSTCKGGWRLGWWGFGVPVCRLSQIVFFLGADVTPLLGIPELPTACRSE